MGLADARLEARKYLGEVVSGEDPAQEKADAKAEMNFGLTALYLERHAAVKKKPHSAHSDKLMLEADLLPAWR